MIRFPKFLRALAVAGGLGLAATAPAQAAGAEKKEEAESARATDVLNLVVPVVRQGRLVNYVFINARIQLAGGVDVWKARDKGAFLRDALLKAVHRQSIAHPERDDSVDPAAAQALIARVARQTLGQDAVRSVEILSVSSLKQGRSLRS
jgi:hypothetical protein